MRLATLRVDSMSFLHLLLLLLGFRRLWWLLNRSSVSKLSLHVYEVIGSCLEPSQKSNVLNLAIMFAAEQIERAAFTFINSDIIDR